MRSSKTRAAAAALACLAAGAIAIAPIGSAAASGHPAAKPHLAHQHKPKHPHGFFVVNHHGKSQKVEDFGTDSSLVRDTAGREHLVTTKPSTSNPGAGHIVYLTRATDKSPWTSHKIPGSIALSGGVQVEAHLSNDGRRVFAVVYSCDGVYVTDAPTNAKRLPVPTLVKSLDECTNPPAHTDNPPVAQAGTLFGRTISILLSDQVADATVWSIYSGEPNGEFVAGTPLPTADGFTPQQVAVDSEYGRIVVVGTGTDGTSEGIYETYQNRFSDTWSDPVLVASLASATADYSIDAVQAFNRHTYIGLEKPALGQHITHSLYLVRGQPSGEWLGTVPLAHTHGHDTNLRLVVNTDTRHLHAAWTRVIPSHNGKSGGLMQEAQNDEGWAKPVYLTHWYRDVPTEITLTNNRHPIVGYDQ